MLAIRRHLRRIPRGRRCQPSGRSCPVRRKERSGYRPAAS